MRNAEHYVSPEDFVNAHGKELDFVYPLLPENPIILEAGAHYGEDTIILSTRWPKGTIYAFEPNPKAFEKLKKAVKDYSNINIFPFGLYSKTGDYPLWVPPENDGTASLLKDNELPESTAWYHGEKPITIFCMNLDQWASQEGVDRIDYMWLDMEGTELQMLNSAPKILKTVKVISTEVNFREFRKGMCQFSEVSAFLEKNGFKLSKLMGTPDWQATALFIKT